MRKAIIVALVGAFVVSTAAFGAGVSSDASRVQETTTVGTETTTTVGTETTTEADTGTAVDENASVSFLNQTAGITFVEETPNDTIVTIERVVVPEGGFVAVHAAENVTGEYELAENVSAGPVLGNSTYLGSGDHANVVVRLDRPLNESQTLLAMVHRDTNDDQQFDFPEADDPYTYLESPVAQSGYVIVTDAEGQQITGDETTTGETATADDESDETTTRA